jgi:8-amino-7-oxononanoate synthase
VSDVYQSFKEQLYQRKIASRYRTLKPIKHLDLNEPVIILQDGRSLINFCSNDYLGLSNHSHLKKKAEAYVNEYGTGATASRLVCGDFICHEELEVRLADWLNEDSALVFNTGFQANTTILSTLTDRESVIIADKLSHNSLVQGALLSKSRLLRYKHNDLVHLEKLLTRESVQGKKIIIVSETVFSMDGDRCDVDGISELASKYNAFLYLDEAHAIGILGENGKGVSFGTDNVDLRLGTFGKAFGVMGAFMTGSAILRDYLINYCPGFIYTTSLSPAVIGAIEGALDLIPEMDEQRRKVHANILYLKSKLLKMGFDTGNSDSQIIPIIIGDEKDTLSLSAYLEEKNILATAIRPPTVPHNSSRIRITLTAKHTRNHIDYFIDVLGNWKNG